MNSPLFMKSCCRTFNYFLLDNDMNMAGNLTEISPSGYSIFETNLLESKSAVFAMNA